MPEVDQGLGVYIMACASCHGAGGRGRLPYGPSLDQAPWLARCSADQLSVLILNGVHGDIPGSPAPYPVMPPLRDWLKDDEVAAVASHVLRTHAVRNEKVPAELVRLLRERTASCPLPWSAAELAALPATPLPAGNVP